MKKQKSHKKDNLLKMYLNWNKTEAKRNNVNSFNDNNNSVINTCRSNIKPNTTEKEEYLKQQKMQV